MCLTSCVALRIPVDQLARPLDYARRPATHCVQAAQAGETAYTHRTVAELGGVVAMQVVVDGGWPDESLRMTVWRHVAHSHAENLLIFTDRQDHASGINAVEQCYWCAVANSFVLDWLLRQSVASTLNMFYLYQLPVPRLPSTDARCNSIARRAAKLICTESAYDGLARDVGLSSHQDGATDPAERERLRAELDGLVAHLYGLSEEEFTHILGTFPLVAEPVKVAALHAWRDVQKGLLD